MHWIAGDLSRSVGSALADALSGFAAQPKRVRQGGPYATPFIPSSAPRSRMTLQDDTRNRN